MKRIETLWSFEKPCLKLSLKLQAKFKKLKFPIPTCGRLVSFCCSTRFTRKINEKWRFGPCHPASITKIYDVNRFTPYLTDFTWILRYDLMRAALHLPHKRVRGKKYFICYNVNRFTPYRTDSLVIFWQTSKRQNKWFVWEVLVQYRVNLLVLYCLIWNTVVRFGPPHLIYFSSEPS